MTNSQLLPHALLHKELDVIITLDKLAELPDEIMRAWKEAPTEILYRLIEGDSNQLTLDFGEKSLDKSKVDS